MRASFLAEYGIDDPAGLDYGDLLSLLWALPDDSAAMRTFAVLLADVADDLPDEGPQTMEQVRYVFDRYRTSGNRKRQVPRYVPFANLRTGPLANDPRLRQGATSSDSGQSVEGEVSF